MWQAEHQNNSVLREDRAQKDRFLAMLRSCEVQSRVRFSLFVQKILREGGVFASVS